MAIGGNWWWQSTLVLLLAAPPAVADVQSSTHSHLSDKASVEIQPSATQHTHLSNKVF
jgi:hypothetical protein